MQLLAPVSAPITAYEIVIPLLVGSVAYERTEAAAFAYCDERGRLSGIRHIRSPLSDMLDLSVRQIAIDTLMHDARIVMMAHNHPNGEALPSRGDHEATRRIATALRALGARLHDHLVVTRDARWSFREAGLL